MNVSRKRVFQQESASIISEKKGYFSERNKVVAKFIFTKFDLLARRFVSAIVP